MWPAGRNKIDWNFMRLKTSRPTPINKRQRDEIRKILCTFFSSLRDIEGEWNFLYPWRDVNILFYWSRNMRFNLSGTFDGRSDVWSHASSSTGMTFYWLPRSLRRRTISQYTSVQQDLILIWSRAWPSTWCFSLLFPSTSQWNAL